MVTRPVRDVVGTVVQVVPRPYGFLNVFDVPADVFPANRMELPDRDLELVARGPRDSARIPRKKAEVTPADDQPTLFE